MEKKKYNHFTLEERCTIARLHQERQSLRKIAAALDRAPSTIAREIKRNSPQKTTQKTAYQPAYADDLAWARRWHGGKLERDDALRKTVLTALSYGWSPEQVAGRIGNIGKETIYRFIYQQIARTKDYAWMQGATLLAPAPKASAAFAAEKEGLLPCASRGVCLFQNVQKSRGWAF